MGDLTVTGANDLAVISAKLRQLGDGGLRREMLAGIRGAAKPLVAVARESAREHLPKGGGLNEVVASSKFGIRTRTSGRTLGVRVVGVSKHNIARMDQGTVRHPTFGNRKAWVTEQITPGWWTDAERAHADEPRRAVIRVLDSVARRL